MRRFADVDARTILGRNIRELRLAAGLSQEALGALVGTDQSRIGEYERAVLGCSIDMIGRIAKALGVPLTALVEEGGAKTLTKKKAPRTIEKRPRVRAKAAPRK